MNTHHFLKTSLIVAAMLALSTAQATTMTKADQKAAKARISATYKADKASCVPLAGNTKDICIEEAKAKEKVAYATLAYDFSGKPADHDKLLVAKAESTYAVAKEKCDDLAGNTKDVCVKEAKAIEVKALADVKMVKQIGMAEQDAATAKRDADYKVAAEKCDALSGDAKSGCIASAKSLFGKS